MTPRRYRVNFGNEQVYEPEPSSKTPKAACLAYIAADPDPRGSFVEWQDPDTGDWFSTRWETT